MGWRKRRQEEEDLEEIHAGVKILRYENNSTTENIEKTHNKVKQTTKHTVQTIKHVNKQNKKLKEIIGKLRKGNKLCLDIILIIIAFGLINALYYIIKLRS